MGRIAFARITTPRACAYEQALALCEQVGDVFGQAHCIKGLGDVALDRSDHNAARRAYRAQALYEQVGDVFGQAHCITGLGDIALARSDHDAVRRAFERALELYTAIRVPNSIGMTHRRLARMAADRSLQRCNHVERAREA